MSPELQWKQSPTELGLWPKDSEQLNLRGLAEDMTPTLLPEYGTTPSVRNDMFSLCLVQTMGEGQSCMVLNKFHHLTVQ
jgi:hypothetical protein